MEDVSCSSLARSHAIPSELATFLFFQCSSLTGILCLWAPSNYFIPLSVATFLSLALWFTAFSSLLPELCFTTTLGSRKGWYCHFSFMDKEPEVQRGLVPSDTAGVQMALLTPSPVLFFDATLSFLHRGKLSRSEGTSREIFISCSEITKTQRRHWWDFPTAIPVIALILPLTLRSLHVSCLCVHGLHFVKELGDTKDIWEILWQLRNLLTNQRDKINVLKPLKQLTGGHGRHSL